MKLEANQLNELERVAVVKGIRELFCEVDNELNHFVVSLKVIDNGFVEELELHFREWVPIQE